MVQLLQMGANEIIPATARTPGENASVRRTTVLQREVERERARLETKGCAKAFRS
jgi:hypothetical protein